MVHNQLACMTSSEIRTYVIKTYFDHFISSKFTNCHMKRKLKTVMVPININKTNNNFSS